MLGRLGICEEQAGLGSGHPGGLGQAVCKFAAAVGNERTWCLVHLRVSFGF